MTFCWAGESYCCEVKDVHSNSMSLHCTGRYALLGGKRALAVVDLEDHTESIKKVTRQSKWEVSGIQWNPHHDDQNTFVTASNQRADLYRWNGSGVSLLGTLKAHVRVISDLDWSRHDAHSLATCSVDSFIFIWDNRDCHKPAVTMQSVAGVSQVKWNRLNPHLLATTHDGEIRIWDTRKPNSAVQYIAGHLSKIHGADWSHVDGNHLATASQDGFVNIWDITNPRHADVKLTSNSPVWRVRYMPLGHGLITVLVPQLRRDENNSAFLWTLDDPQIPLHTFRAHSDVVLDFQWKQQADNPSECQLITWCKDQSLRIWPVDTSLLQVVSIDRKSVV